MWRVSSPELAWEGNNTGVQLKAEGQGEGLPLLPTDDKALPDQEEGGITAQSSPWAGLSGVVQAPLLPSDLAGKGHTRLSASHQTIIVGLLPPTSLARHTVTSLSQTF